MINFRIMLDISSIYNRIKHLKLKSYASPFPTIFVTANDPDDACAVCINQLIKIIMDQDSSIEMRILCRKIKHQCKIDKIYILN